MAGRNGASTIGRVLLRLPDLSPETMTIPIIRDGDEVMLAAYVSGKRCPIPVTIAQSSAFDHWNEARTDSTLSQADQNSAYLLYVRDTLKAVIPGLEMAEADVIAGDPELRQEILVGLKWWVLNETAEAESDPEAGGMGRSITDDSSPDSAPSTASV